MKQYLTLVGILLILMPTHALLAQQNNFTGIWELTDNTGDRFYIQVSADHTVQSTYAKGDNAIVPQHGLWRMNGNELHITYNNGALDVIQSDKGSYSRTTYAPGEAASKKGGTSTPAFRVGLPQLPGAAQEADFSGYWKLQDENQKPFFLRLNADHSARSTYGDGQNGLFGEAGTWRLVHNCVMVLYDSGWVDVIVKKGSSYSKYAFAPGQSVYTKPNNTSAVERASMAETGVK